MRTLKRMITAFALAIFTFIWVCFSTAIQPPILGLTVYGIGEIGIAILFIRVIPRRFINKG